MRLLSVLPQSAACLAGRRAGGVAYQLLESSQLTLLPTKYNGQPPRLGRAIACACCFLVAAARAEAQWALGPWDDATVMPRGVLRAGVATWWTHANERFQRTSSRVESLGADFDIASLDERIFENIGLLRAPLETLSGLVNPALSLGRLQADYEETSYVVPITFDYGLTGRLTLTALVPYIKTRAEVFPHPNPAGPEGSIGVNPALSAPGARTQNTLVFSQLSTATTRLQAELVRCLNNSDPTCSAINANRQAAAALVSTGTASANAIATIYGTNAVGTAPGVAGSAYVPVGTRALQSAIDAQLAALSSQFQTFLGAPPAGAWIAARPVGAPPLAYEHFQSILTDSAFLVIGRRLTDIERSHLGDIEVGAKLLLLDTFGAPVGRAPTRTSGARLAVGGLLRLGTGQRDSPEDFADIGTGDRQRDIELRGALDLVLARRWWGSAVARYGIQRADQLPLRVPFLVPGPALSETPFPAAARQFEIDRDLGDYLELEFSPRFTPNANFAFSGHYRLRRKQADRYSAANCASVDPTLCTALAMLGEDTEHREQRAGFAVTYSTLSGYSRRRSPWPLEISLSHTQVLSGRGVRKEFITAAGIRLYQQFFGRDALRATPR